MTVVYLIHTVNIAVNWLAIEIAGVYYLNTGYNIVIPKQTYCHVLYVWPFICIHV